MIVKWYEVICDTCGWAAHYLGSVSIAEQQFRSSGGMVKGKKHYCDETCYKKRGRGNEK